MDLVPRLIGHHASAWGIAIELAVVVVVATLLAAVWWRGRRRKPSRPTARMRDDDA